MSIRTAASLAAMILLAIPAFLFADGDEKKGKKDKESAVIAQIRISGDLDETPTASDPLFGGSSESFRTKLERLSKAKSDANVKVVLLQVRRSLDRLGKG